MGGGVCLLGWGLPAPWHWGQTDGCENITFPQLHLRAVNIVIVWKCGLRASLYCRKSESKSDVTPRCSNKDQRKIFAFALVFPQCKRTLNSRLTMQGLSKPGYSVFWNVVCIFQFERIQSVHNRRRTQGHFWQVIFHSIFFKEW